MQDNANSVPSGDFRSNLQSRSERDLNEPDTPTRNRKWRKIALAWSVGIILIIIVSVAAALGGPKGKPRCMPGERKSGSSCEECSPGRYSSEYDAQECIPCSPGSYSFQVKQSSCTSCPVGKFAAHGHAFWIF